MDVLTVREIAAALVVFGATGTVSMAIYEVALKSSAAELLPVASAARVRWWSGHRTAAAGISVVLLVIGLAGLLIL